MAENITNGINSLEITENSNANKVQPNAEEGFESWGFPLEELYKLALHFYREKSGKGLHLTYKDKLRMVALTKQGSYGKYRADVSPDVGFLDVVGNDRKQAWQSLGEMTKADAMGEFVKSLDTLCPLFRPHVIAQKAEQEQAEQKRREEEELKKKEEEDKERKLLEEEAQRQLKMERHRQMEQENQIRAALNQQTEQQFRQYAEQQCPGNVKQQEELITQLQEQHFQQYMQQVYQQQLLHQQQQYQQLQAMQAQKQGAGPPNTIPPGAAPAPGGPVPDVSPPANVTITTNAGVLPPAAQAQAQQVPPPQMLPANIPNGPVVPPHMLANNVLPEQNGVNNDDSREDEELSALDFPTIQPAKMWVTKEVDEFRKDMAKCKDNVIHIGSLSTATVSDDELPPIAAASMWTRQDIKEFKDSLRKDKDSVIKVGSGETVTVRVPTHEDGSCLFWEFASDYYDIGFGVYFEWTIAPSNTVSVHVSESSDEEELEEEEPKANDVEKGGKKDDRPPMDEIIPVYRRDCHEEVYCGSHAYPGRGVYLLKFDNSYSLWRSKTLYYRVYYSR